ncbi:hypothetical protein E1264_25055 [Actinomadura sp. KC216]|uniref:hypothetical protein n=1 Tax=Actinomadura sp. KC216 TaxID=2530370 RepID=UPI0010490640|nr:hypothetical protein [Actinomadura sp. KC216]TDB84315.1 hypothetical protein E1264_25055 [Actinomadura sp. KC216]
MQRHQRAAQAARTCMSCRSALNSQGPKLCSKCTNAVLDAGWEAEPLRRALARLDLSAVVVLMRVAAQMSQEEFGQVVGQWSQTTVSLIESGKRDTLYDIRELLACTDAIGMPRRAIAPLISGDPDATLVSEHEDGMQGDHVERRRFNSLMAALMATAALPGLDAPARVERSDIETLRTSLTRLRSDDQELGGGAVVHQARRQYARARRMLDESDYTDVLGSELLVITGELAEEAGWAAFDSGDHQAARFFYNEAHVLALSSGDVELQAHVLQTMSMQVNHLAGMAKHRRERNRYAREGLRLADGSAAVARHEGSPRLQALVATRQAVAHANLGDAAAFRKSITRARHELDRGPSTADRAWTAFVTSGEVDAAEASGYLRLGEAQRSVEIHSNSLNDTELSPRNRACAQGHLAATLLEVGDTAEAINSGLEAVIKMTAENITSVRPLNRMHRIRNAAERSGHEEFCAKFDAATHALAV